MESATRPTADVIAGALLAALGVYVVLGARQWTFLAPDGPGPGFFPLCYGVLLVGGSLALVLSGLKRRADASAAERTDWAGVARALGMWAMFALMIPAMTYLGFAAALALIIVFFLRVVFPQSWSFTLIAAVLTPIGFLLIFPMMLQVQLPVGQWTGF